MFLKAQNELRMKFLLVYEVLTNSCVLARTRNTFIDVFLAVKARKSRGTVTAGKEVFNIDIWFRKKKIICLSENKNLYTFNDSNYILYGVSECEHRDVKAWKKTNPAWQQEN